MARLMHSHQQMLPYLMHDGRTGFRCELPGVWAVGVVSKLKHDWRAALSSNGDKKQYAAIFLVALLTLALSSTAAAGGPVAIMTVSVDPPAPSLALARYLARAGEGGPWSEPNSVLMEIDASLPGLAERGHLRAIRDWAEHQTPDYQVIHIEGDAMVKQQVIARYLTVERRAAAVPASSVAVTPANYKFRYVASGGGQQSMRFI